MGSLAQHPVRFFVLTLGICLGASVAFASGLHEILPVKGLWLVAVLTSIFITFSIFFLRSKITWLDYALTTIIVSAVSCIIITLASFVILYFSSSNVVINPPGLSEVEELSTRVAHLESQMRIIEGDLSRLGLSVAQIENIQETYVNNGTITVSDLIELGLNQTQVQQVEAILRANDLITMADLDSYATAVSLKETAVAESTEAALCYIQPLFRAVNLRFSPKEPAEGEVSNFHSILSQREIVRVIGHNGGDINYTRWWLVELPSEQDPERRNAWVWSGVVEEINLTACDNLPQYIR